MRNVRSVYTKLRDVKYFHLTKLYKEYLKKIPENCKYNFRYQISEKAEIRLCLLHQPDLDLSKGIYPYLIDVCQIPEHCKNCNAFICKYSKEDIQTIFDNELGNQKLKAKKYPDICALEWVLEQSVVGIPPLNYIQKIFFFLRRWITQRML